MDKTAQQDLHWARLMYQLEHECGFKEHQFNAIGFAVASAKISAEEKIQIVERIIKAILKK